MLSLAQLCVDLVCSIAILKVVQAGPDVVGIVTTNGALVGGEDHVVRRVVDLGFIIEGDDPVDISLTCTGEGQPWLTCFDERVVAWRYHTNVALVIRVDKIQSRGNPFFERIAEL